MSDDIIAQAAYRSEQAISSIEASRIDPPDATCPNCGSDPLLLDEEGFCLKCNNKPEADNPRDEHDPVRDHEEKEARDENDKALYEAGL